MRIRNKNNLKSLILVIIVVALLCFLEDSYGLVDEYFDNNSLEVFDSSVEIDSDNGFYDIGLIPEYSGKAYIAVNNNIPYFDDDDIIDYSFEKYSELDNLERSGVAFASISLDTMPTEERGSIGSIKPSGWHTVKYDIVDGKYLYNRCHLIGYQLTGENANPNNLITCTRYMNTVGMLEFENKVADYVKKTGNHVLYRVTPIYEGDNLLASGVEMEGYSVEDKGQGISFNVYVYNVQEGITIDYSTGDSKEIN